MRAAMEINGMAHVVLTVSDFEAARAFYGELLPFLGLRPVLDVDEFFYCVGGRTALGIAPAEPAHAGERFVQRRVGLHHLCFRARERADVDAVHALACRSSARRSSTRPRTVRGPRDTTRCCSRIPTASGSRSTTCRARGCSRPT